MVSTPFPGGSGTCDQCGTSSDEGAILCQTSFMTDTPVNPLAHFGKQVKKERLARGWSLPELERRTGIDAGHWSRIERGVRPPTELIAGKCDEAFPERQGWFSE